METVKSKNGYANLVTSFTELNGLQTYAESILDSVKTMKKYPEAQILHGIELKMTFSRAQAIADYAKVASKRTGKKPMRDDHLKLVKKASETFDMT